MAASSNARSHVAVSSATISQMYSSDAVRQLVGNAGAGGSDGGAAPAGVFVPTHALTLRVGVGAADAGSAGGPAIAATPHCLFLAIDASSSMMGPLFRRSVQVARSMATRALLDGFARVYLIKYSTGAESWQCSNIEHLEQLLTTHFSECGGMTDFVAAFGTLATLMEAATGACGPETSHHVFFLTDGEHFTADIPWEEKTPENCLRICMPAIDDLQARSQVLTAGGATIVINAIVIADGDIPIMQVIVTDNGTMVFVGGSDELLDREPELVELVGAVQQSITLTIGFDDFVFKGGEHTKELAINLDENGRGEVHAFIQCTDPDAAATLAQGDVVVARLTTDSVVLTVDEGAMVEVRHPELEESAAKILGFSSPFDIIDGSDPVERREQQITIRQSMDHAHAFGVLFQLMGILRDRVHLVETGLADVSSEIIAMQRLPTPEERAAHAGVLLKQVQVYRETLKVASQELSRVKGRGPDPEMVEAYEAERETLIGTCSAVRTTMNNVIETLSNVHRSGVMLQNSDLRFHVQNTYARGVQNSARASRFALRQERNTDMLREDDERLAELRRSGALSRVLIPDDHPASRDLCCPFSLEIPNDGPMVLTLDIGDAGEHAEVWIDDPSLTDIKAAGRFLSWESFLDCVQNGLESGRGGMEPIMGENLMAISAFRGALPMYLFPEHWAEAKCILRSALGFTATGAVSGYAGRQLDTLPYLTLYALLSGPLTEHNTKVLLIIRRTVQAIIADYKFANRFYDETLAVFGTSRDRRLPDATGSSLVPAVMQMMVRAADEREFVDFLVAAAAESFRRSVKATLKDVEPGDIDSFVSHVLGASAAIENYTNALAAEEAADAVVDDMEVAATAASVDAYVDAVIEGMARAKAAARKLRNRKRAQRRRRARAAAAAVSDANATASTTASEAATPSAPAEDGDEDGEGVPSLEQIGLVSTGNADADTELATEIHTYGWTMPEGVLYPEAKRDETEGHLERSYSSLLGALSRKLAWHVRMLQTALNGYRAFAALPEDTDGILDANFGLATDELVQSFRDAMAPVEAIAFEDGDNGVDFSGLKAFELLIGDLGVHAPGLAVVALLTEGAVLSHNTSAYRTAVATDDYADPTLQAAAVIAANMRGRLSKCARKLEQVRGAVDMEAVKALAVTTSEPKIFAGVLRRYGDYPCANTNSLLVNIQMTMEDPAYGFPAWKIRMLCRLVWLTAPGEAGCLHVPLVKGFFDQVPEGRKFHPGPRHRKRLKYIHQRVHDVGRSKKWWRQTFGQRGDGEGAAGEGTSSGVRAAAGQGSSKNVAYFFG